MSEKENTTQDNELTIKDLFYKINSLFLILKNKYKVILISVVIGGMIGFVYSYIEKPTYKAELTFALDDEKASVGGGGGLGGALGIASSLGIDLGSGGGGAFAASNIIELMKSRLIIEKSLLNEVYINKRKSNLIEYYIKVNKLKEKWSKYEKLSKIHFSSDVPRSKIGFLQDSILKVVYKKLVKDNLVIYQKDKKVTIISIVVTTNDELFSKLFCEILAKQVSEFYVETKSKKARNNVEILQKQVDSIKNELGNSIIGMASASDNVYNLNPSLNIKGSLSRKKQIDVQTNTAIMTQISAQLELAKVTLRKETPLIQLIDLPILPLDKYELKPIISIIYGSIYALFAISLFVIFQTYYKK